MIGQVLNWCCFILMLVMLILILGVKEATFQKQTDDSDQCDGEDCGEHNVWKGSKGDKGERGIAGVKGEQGDCPLRSITQFAWRGLNSDSYEGVLMSFYFVKMHQITDLRVTWNGDMRLAAPAHGGPACRRWYFTFNDVECKDPFPIDGQLFTHVNGLQDNIHKPSTIDGICSGIESGSVKIDFVIGDCTETQKYNFDIGNPFTGWESTSKIIVEEIMVQGSVSVKAPPPSIDLKLKGETMDL